MGKHDNQRMLDFTNHWILLGITLSVLGFLPVAVHGVMQTVIMGALGLLCIGTGVYGKLYKRRIDKTAEMIPPYAHYPEVLIENTSHAMDAIMGRF